MPDGWQARSESEQPIGAQSSQLAINHDYNGSELATNGASAVTHHGVWSDHVGFALINGMTGRVHDLLVGSHWHASSRLVSIKGLFVRPGLRRLWFHRDRLRADFVALRQNSAEWHFLLDHFQP